MRNLSNLSIVPALLSDAPSIVDLHKDCVIKINSKFYPNKVIKEWLDQVSIENVQKQFKNSSWITAKLKGALVGFAQYSLDCAEIYQINVSPKLQQRGIGRVLYNYMLGEFLKKKIRKVSLNSTLNAAGFYKRLGFRSLGRIRFKLNREFVEMVRMEAKIA